MRCDGDFPRASVVTVVGISIAETKEKRKYFLVLFFLVKIFDVTEYDQCFLVHFIITF